MSRTNIEWCDYTINPVKGLCPVDCKDNQGKSYCYARRMYKRFKWNPEIRYDPDAFKGLPSKAAQVFKLFDLFCKRRGNIRIEELGRRNETDKV